MYINTFITKTSMDVIGCTGCRILKLEPIPLNLMASELVVFLINFKLYVIVERKI